MKRGKGFSTYEIFKNGLTKALYSNILAISSEPYCEWER